MVYRYAALVASNTMEEEITSRSSSGSERVTVRIDDDSFISFHNLELNRKSFETNLKLRLRDSTKLKTAIVSEDILELYLQDDILDPVKIVCSANWEALGSYSIVNPKTQKFKTDEPVPRVEVLDDVHEGPEAVYNWMWAWHAFPDERSEKLKEYMKDLPPETKFLAKDNLSFEDPVIISYIFAYMMEQMKLEYVLVHFNDSVSHAFGIWNIKWHIPIDPDLLKEFEETQQTKLAGLMKPDGKPINWDNLFKAYKDIYNARPSEDTSNATRATEDESKTLDEILDKMSVADKEELLKALNKDPR